MRAHGVPNFPDPDPRGNFPSFSTGVSKQTSTRCNDACKNLLPSGGTATPQQRQQKLAFALKVAACLRAHGYPELPRPDAARAADACLPGSTRARRSSRRRRRPASSRRGRRSACHEIASSRDRRRVIALALLACAAAARRNHVPLGRSRAAGAGGARRRVRPVHALPRRAELARPRQQRRARQGSHVAATRGQQLPVPGGSERVQAPAPERRQRAEPRPGAAGQGAGAELLPVRARPRRPELPRPRAATARIPDPATVGINQGSPKFEAANQACRKYRPPYMPSNAAYNVWARAHPNGS